jgi:hypothetical protein
MFWPFAAGPQPDAKSRQLFCVSIHGKYKNFGGPERTIALSVNSQKLNY